jgi:hypothetical protein
LLQECISVTGFITFAKRSRFSFGSRKVLFRKRAYAVCFPFSLYLQKLRVQLKALLAVFGISLYDFLSFVRALEKPSHLLPFVKRPRCLFQAVALAVHVAMPLTDTTFFAFHA